MAYRTQWRLSIGDINDSKISKLQIEEIEDYITENDDMRWVLGEGLHEWGEDDRSFSDYEKHMYEISKDFPHIIFTLEYEPINDQIGRYVEYWFNGEVQKEMSECIINVGKFDVNKLKHVM